MLQLSTLWGLEKIKQVVRTQGVGGAHFPSPEASCDVPHTSGDFPGQLSPAAPQQQELLTRRLTSSTETYRVCPFGFEPHGLSSPVVTRLLLIHSPLTLIYKMIKEKLH